MNNKNKTAFIFPGQGSQYPGMGREINSEFRETDAIFECGSDILGFDLKKICFGGSAEELGRTLYSQPAIYAVSLCALKCAEASGIKASSVAGHSLGEYAAATTAGALTMEDGFKFIKSRSIAMENASKQSAKGSMYAIMGIDSEKIKEICDNTEGYVVPVNYNSPVQTVIAGESDAVERAVSSISGPGVKMVKLNVSSAFHSKLMRQAAGEFLAEILSIPLKQPDMDFYSNITGAKASEITHEYFARHMIRPVLFRNEIDAMYNAGYTRYIELGPGKVLSGLIKRIVKETEVYNIEDKKSLSNTVEKLSDK